MDQFSHDPSNYLSGDDAARQRNESRDSLFLIANVRVGIRGESVQVRVRNLSAGGLMAEYAKPIEIGAPIEIDVRGIGWVTGRIAWVAEGRVGVAFDTQIDPMLARKPVGGGPKGDSMYLQKPLGKVPPRR